MSRCFPFPPPGYERKTKEDDTDLLKKEKQKEKKHKKEKKDKEKKEGKEKREKDRNDEKQRDKKDRKEKQKDKKKDKEKDRDKDKHKSDLLLSDEKKVVGSTDSHVHKSSDKSKHRENDRNATSAEKRIGGLSAVPNGMVVHKNNHQVPNSKSFKCTPELGRKSMDEERRTVNQLSDKNVGAERNKDGGVVKLAAKSGGPLLDSKERDKDGGVVKLAAKSGGPLLDSKERTKEKPALDGRMDGRGVIGDARPSKSPLDPKSVGVVQNRVGGILRPVEKKIEQKVEGKEKVREKEGDDKKGDRRKEKDREKSVLKDREKEKKKEEVAKTTYEEKHLQMTRMKDGSENHLLKPSAKNGTMKDVSGVQSVGFHNITKDSNHHTPTVNNRKRKDIGLNGTYDELVTGPNKMARTTTSPHQLTENGRILEPCQNSAAFAPATQRPPVNIKGERNLPHDDTQRPPMKIKMDGKECKINGTIVDPCTQSSRETTAKAERKSDAPAKPPHPDTKYLGQVLVVPKLDEWSDLVDQEWLFNSNSSSTRRPDVKLSGIDETPQVWERALWLEPVDIHALPYVIPH
ncbi:hypothetical protein BVRB_3g065560 [Beta vulgaris subsp. vulgaris]|uniref:Uncharacterized protein n=1 Tax=Beta vulgaris subsp. vulgaris TaxID=3555 RepID=A0A0J8CMS0_BETVV|nr:hypothetical protein BVRB_3g065560 [Beta vulgaris subsp. vulgaris]